MKKVQTFEPSDRYYFDFEECTVSRGFAQVDTAQDASYFGNWVNPLQLEYVGYCEGDVTRIKFDTPQEFCKFMREFSEWETKHNGKPAKIDGMCSAKLITAFKNLGLAGMLH